VLLGFPRFDLIEPFGDGRHIVVPADGPSAGQLIVIGDSNREPEAARMGYLPRQAVRVPRPRPPRVRAFVAAHPGHAAADAADALRVSRQVRALAFTPLAERRAVELLETLLDEVQTAHWRRWGSFWVDTPRGPVRLGKVHDLRFRPRHRPGEEWSLCVVPAGTRLPIGDVWSNLLLVLAVEPARFFKVANVRRRDLVPSLPHPD
jgi:hypothetical protein